jgi:hypothetical protein
MTMKPLFYTVLAMFISAATYAQCDSTAHLASRHLGKMYVSDGQQYRALIHDDQTAEFTTTFYSGHTYRVSAMGGFAEGQLLFSLYDIENNLIYTNEAHRNAPYWNFKVENTLTLRVEAKLDTAKQSSGCAVLLIGFER